MTENETIEKPAPKPRRWLRFSLRALFVVVTLACLTLGYFVSQARQQRLAVEALHRTDAACLYDYQLESGRSITDTLPRSWVPEFALNALGTDMFHSVVAVGWGYQIRGTTLELKDVDLEPLASLDEVTAVEFPSKYVTARGLATLRKMPNLRYLELEIPLGKLELEELKKFTRLETLEISTNDPVPQSEYDTLSSSLPNTNVTWFEIHSIDVDPEFKLSK